MLNSIEKEWQGFSTMVFNNTKPSPIQVSEMRKAFFAGAFSVLCMMQEIGEPHISEDEGCNHLENVKQECETFYKEMIKEYAQRN